MATRYIKLRLMRSHSFGNFDGDLVSQSLKDNEDICSALFFLIHPSRLKYEDIRPTMISLQEAEKAFMQTFMTVNDKQTGLLLALEGKEPERIFKMIEHCKPDNIEQIRDKALMLWWN